MIMGVNYACLWLVNPLQVTESQIQQFLCHIASKVPWNYIHHILNTCLPTCSSLFSSYRVHVSQCMYYCFLYLRPHELYLNPLEVESITVRQATKLDANHSLVVYKQHDEHIERRIVNGPTVFIPGPHEWYI